jgi:hypothetical protein
MLHTSHQSTDIEALNDGTITYMYNICIPYVYNIMYGIILTYIYTHIYSYLCYYIGYNTYLYLPIVRSLISLLWDPEISQYYWEYLLPSISINSHIHSDPRFRDFGDPKSSSPPPTLLSLYSFNNCQVQKEVIFWRFFRVFAKITGFGDLEI